MSARAHTGLRILFVEDNEEIRDALSALLEDEGYEVTTAKTAHEGLAQLRAGRFHLLLSDYALGDRTGTWMIEQARSEGRIRNEDVLLVTAQLELEGTEGLRVIRKPLDLDDFLRVVDQMLERVRAAEVAEGAARLRAQPDGAPKLELTLYISSASLVSLRSLRMLERLLAEHDPTQVRLTVRDLAAEPLRAEEDVDHILFTPTLVKRAPAPRMWLVGDQAQERGLRDLMGFLGVEKKRTP